MKEADGRPAKGDPLTKIKDTKLTNEAPIHSANMEQIGTEEGGNVEDMELGELDLEGIEKACDNLKTRYILFNQLVIFKEPLIKSKGS